MAIIIPDGFNIHQYVNQVTSSIHDKMQRFQTYYDDWGTLPQGVKDAVKTRATTMLDNQITFFNELKTYIQGL